MAELGSTRLEVDAPPRRPEPWEERIAREVLAASREGRVLRVADALLERIEAELEDEDFDVDRVSDLAGALGQLAYSVDMLRTITGVGR